MDSLGDYKRLLTEALHCRAEGDEEGEDRILDALDGIWRRMSEEERTAADVWVQSRRGDLLT